MTERKRRWLEHILKESRAYCETGPHPKGGWYLASYEGGDLKRRRLEIRLTDQEYEEWWRSQEDPQPPQTSGPGRSTSTE